MAGSAREAPTCPSNWHILAYSNELKSGAVLSRTLGDIAVTLYRTRRSGEAVALAGKCAHMGCDLGRGAVVGDWLRCPLHHRMIAPDGTFLVPIGSASTGLRQRRLLTRERWGCVFAFAGDTPDFDLPTPALCERPTTAIARLRGKAFSAQPWWALVGNGMDMEHMHAVHDRRLMEKPVVTRLDDRRLCLTYRTEPTGRGLGDWVMRRLAKDGVRARITCAGGSMLIVETRVGARESFIILSMAPTGAEGAIVRGVVGVSPGGRISAWIACRLFMAFLKKDLGVLDGYVAREPKQADTIGDEITRAVYAFFRDQVPFPPPGWKEAS